MTRSRCAAAFGARPRPRARRRLADRRPGARQLRDGRLRAARQRARPAPSVFRVAGAGFAGGRFEGVVGARECVRIMTGAVMPAGSTPSCRRSSSASTATRSACHPGSLQPGDNRRLAGEDLARGETALAAGRIVRPADLGLLASLGAAEVAVFRRLRVAFFSTGDELARSASRSTPARSTTATATRSAACCSASASTCSIWASCATSRRRWRRHFAPPLRPPTR